MKFMTVFIFSPAVWQSGAGHKASTLQFMQISALQRMFLLFPVFRSRGVLAIKIWGVELGLLAGGWQQVGEVASCRVVVSVQAGSISQQPLLVPSVCRSISCSGWLHLQSFLLPWSAGVLPLVGYSLDYSPRVHREILIMSGGKHNKVFYQKNKHECANKSAEIIKVRAV